jgi:hypothetical protein
MSATRYVATYFRPVMASSAMLTARRRSSSVPFTVMHMKIRVRDDAESGMNP